MAFVQVVRRSMRPEEYTDLRAGWLKRFLYESKYEIKESNQIILKELENIIYDND